jgi:hypothetical protein
MKIMKTFLQIVAMLLIVPVLLLAQANTADEIKGVNALYKKAQFGDAVLKATDLLNKPGLTTADSIKVIQLLYRAAAQNKQTKIAKDYLSVLVKMDPSTYFGNDNEPEKVRNTFFQFASESGFTPGKQADVMTVAIVDFDNGSLTDAEKYEKAGIGIGALIRYDLVESGVVFCPSRDHINYLVDELKLSQTDMADQAKKLQVGKVVGAKNFIFGTFMNMPGNKCRIDARIIETETTLPKKQFTVEGKSSDLGKLTSDLTKQILGYFNVQADAIKKVGANVPNVNLAAVTKWSQGVAYEEKGQIDLAQKAYADAIKLSPSFALAADRQQRVSLDISSDHQ